MISYLALQSFGILVFRMMCVPENTHRAIH